MRWYWSVFILIALAAGVYFHFITFDPISFIMLAVLLFNTHILMQRQEQMVEFIKKSHDVITANQKIILDTAKATRADLKKK